MGIFNIFIRGPETLASWIRRRHEETLRASTTFGGVADPEGSRRIADEAGFAKRNISDVLASHRRH